ncbi:glycosyltransferase family 4 protein [Cognatishimia sp.]|uniref:glycosyltransferase family 4 protein n=1 Tax=Cognatishimia sp. TaxID=2211648 RepID=UPI003516FD95|nr:glycosyltransferase [Cognatishimia sp.]
MNILFIHQNFPGQFKNLAPALAARGDRCVALTLRVKKPTDWKGVRILPYQITRKPGDGVHPWLVDLNTKLHRGEACMVAAMKLKASGFTPDVIVAHPGWGESLFLRDIWPEARIGLYYELFYQANAADSGFDPEFARADDAMAAQRIRMKNVNNHLHLPLGDMGICPTDFQAASFPKVFRDRISVIHDGIDTEVAKPNPDVVFDLPDGGQVTRKDQVITFVNRNLEPYRGFHVFMRALPQILRESPDAHVLIVGGEERSYGPAAPDGRTWKTIFTEEVRPQISDTDWARVRFLGKLPYDRFLTLLQVSTVHVYLTYPFVLSWSLLEAMSCGAAIVASDTAPVREVISHGETGRLVDFFDTEALAKEIRAVLDDPEMRTEVGRRARSHVVANYDLTTIALPKQLEWIDRLKKRPAGSAEPWDFTS